MGEKGVGRKRGADFQVGDQKQCPWPPPPMMSPFLSLVNRMDEDLKELLADAFTVYEYPAGTLLFDEGALCSETHVVVSGQAVVYHPEVRD